MKRTSILILAAAASLLTACFGGKAKVDPFQASIEAKVNELTGGNSKVTITEFERVDSTTFGEELAHRRTVFTQRQNQNQKLHDEYKASGMSKNARKKKFELSQDSRVLKGLDRIEENIKDIMNDIAYYDCRFSGNAVAEDGTLTEFKDNYAAISPEGVVLSVNHTQKGLHKALGHVLPGYKDLLKRNPKEKEE